MKVNIYRTLWGLQGFETVQAARTSLQQLKDKGYKGIEVATLFTPNLKQLSRLCREMKMGMITQIHTQPEKGKAPTVENHLDSLKREAEKALKYDPVLINCHAGYDGWREADSIKFFEKAMDVSKEIRSNLNNGFPLAFETHRLRAMYSPFVTKVLLQEIEDLRINLDISHWHLVCERTLNSENDPEWEQIKDLVQKRALQIHARVGSAESIQVNHPSNQENKTDLDWYENVWESVVEKQANDKKIDNFFITTEFGPYPYQPVQPQTLNPVTDLQDVNDWMKQYLQNSFQKYI